jgi:uncharacterized membrane protein
VRPMALRIVREPPQRQVEWGLGLLLVGAVLSGASYQAGLCQGIDDYYIDLMAFGRGLGYRHAEHLLDDPMIRVALVPIVGQAEDPQSIARATRVYYPRSYEALAESDVVLFDEAPLGFGGFTNFYPNILGWFKKMVIDGGKAISMFGGDASFGGGVQADYPSWDETPVAEVLPVDIIPGGNRNAPGWPSPSNILPLNIKFIDDVMGLSRLPWEEASAPQFQQPLNAVTFRQGATREAVGAYRDQEFPLIAFWRMGEGRGLAYTAVFGSGGSPTIIQWEWYPDFVTYMIYNAAGVPSPQDVNLPHVFREKMRTFRNLRVLAYASVDFANKLGANTAKLEEALGELSSDKNDVSLTYLKGEYEDAVDEADELLLRMGDALQEIGKLEKRTMFWIYLTEWCVVSGTSVLVGWVLYFLMVRRALYREVGTTKLG